MPYSTPRGERVLLLFFIDGLGFDLAKELQFLRDELRITWPVKTVLGYSVAAQTSILTGKYPQEHGGLCMFYRTDSSSIFWWIPWLRRLGRLAGRHLVNRRKIEEWTRKLYKITGYFATHDIPLEMLPELQLFERTSVFLPKAIHASDTLIDEMIAAQIPYEVYYWNTPEEDSFDRVNSSLREKRKRCHLLYLSKLDAVLHVHGNFSQETQAKLRWYEEQIRRTLDVARNNYRHVDVVVFSDHGMVDVREYWDLASELKPMESDATPNYRVMYDASMARFWFGTDNHLRSRIMAYLEGSAKGRWIEEKELKSLGAFFPDNRYGEEIFLAHGGVVIMPNFFGDFPVKGMHGYHPEEKSYSAYWGTNRVDLPKPVEITDNFALVKGLILGSG